MYWTARLRIAPLAFSPDPLGTIRPSSLIPSLMFPRRRRSTSFCEYVSTSVASDERRRCISHGYPFVFSPIRHWSWLRSYHSDDRPIVKVYHHRASRHRLRTRLLLMGLPVGLHRRLSEEHWLVVDLKGRFDLFSALLETVEGRF